MYVVFRNTLDIQQNIQCPVYTAKYTVYYIEYTVYARIHRIYTVNETKKAGSFVGDGDAYSQYLCDI